MIVMGAMRDSAKWVMLILALAFVGWLVLDWVESRGGAGVAAANPVVARVGTDEVRYSEWNRFLETQMELARQQNPDGGMTQEESRQVREGAFDELVSQLLIQSELDRLGIRVTDEEIRQAFRNNPPPDLMSHPAFQTEGRFDIQKYREYFSSPTVDPMLLLQIEDYYRRTLPRMKLLNRLVEGVYVSEEEAWRYYRDTNETTRVRYVSVDPGEVVAAEDVEVTEDEVRAYHRENREDFRRPATARVHLVSVPLDASPGDSAEARTLADSLRQAIADGRDFEEVAAEFALDAEDSADGEPVRRVRGEMEPALEEAAFSLPPNRVSEPISTSGGYTLLRVEERTGDTVRVREVRVPLRMSMATEDSIFDRIDRLEGIALDTDLPTAADSLGIPIRRDVSLTRGGGDFVPGAGPLGVAIDWAFEAETRPDDLSPFFQNAGGYHVLELVERRPEGTYTVEEVGPEIRQRILTAKRKERARERIRDALAELGGDIGLEALAERFGWEIQESRPFRRVDFVPGLGEGTEAVGAAFGLGVGKTSGVLEAGDRLAVIEVVEREPASREAFAEVADQLQQELTMQRRQQYTEAWMEALRERADVQDMRDRLQTESTRAS